MTWLLRIASYLTIGAVLGEVCLRGQKILRREPNYLSWTFVVLFWPFYVAVIAARCVRRSV